jgi:hypothetical protein
LTSNGRLEKKHEPVSDIDTAAADSLKALDLEWPIREADILRALRDRAKPAEPEAKALACTSISRTSPVGALPPTCSLGTRRAALQ